MAALRSVRRFPRLPIAVALLALVPWTAAAGVRDERPNLVGGELMGRGIVLTLNYERFLTNTFGLGGGFMAIGTSDGSAYIVPLYASIVPGDTHSLYLSGGLAFVGGSDDIGDYENEVLLQAAIGYQHQSNGGFFVRPFFDQCGHGGFHHRHHQTGREAVAGDVPDRHRQPRLVQAEHVVVVASDRRRRLEVRRERNSSELRAFFWQKVPLDGRSDRDLALQTLLLGDGREE